MAPLFVLKTTKAHAFKQMLEAMQLILKEANIEIHRDHKHHEKRRKKHAEKKKRKQEEDSEDSDSDNDSDDDDDNDKKKKKGKKKVKAPKKTKKTKKSKNKKKKKIAESDDDSDSEKSDEDSDDDDKKKKKKSKLKSKGSEKRATDCKGGLKILAMNDTKSVLVHVFLEACNFEVFECNVKKYFIMGVDMPNLYNYLKNCDTSDVLTLSIDSNDTNHLRIKLQNKKKRRIINSKLNLIEADPGKIKFELEGPESVITIKSETFQQDLKNIKEKAEYIEIKNVGKQFSLSCRGEGGSEDIEYQDSKENEDDDDDYSHAIDIQNANEDEVIQGIYEIKYLVMFTKCARLCDKTEIYMKNDFPIIIQYKVSSLGAAVFCLSPVTEGRDEEDLDELEDDEEEADDNKKKKKKGKKIDDDADDDNDNESDNDEGEKKTNKKEKPKTKEKEKGTGKLKGSKSGSTKGKQKKSKNK